MIQSNYRFLPLAVESGVKKIWRRRYILPRDLQETETLDSFKQQTDLLEMTNRPI